jgi:hypothetical protein
MSSPLTPSDNSWSSSIRGVIRTSKFALLTLSGLGIMIDKSMKNFFVTGHGGRL